MISFIVGVVLVVFVFLLLIVDEVRVLKLKYRALDKLVNDIIDGRGR